MRQFLLPALLLLAYFTQAQTTYYSKPTATDFNNLSSWGTATNGTGAAPASISSADIFVVGNGASLTLSAPAVVGGLYIGSSITYIPFIANGTLTLSGSDSLTVSQAIGNTATMAIGSSGTLTMSGGKLIINGNLKDTAGQLIQNGGSIVVDGNSGIAATSVAGTSLVKLGGSGAYIALNSGTLTIVDPPAGSSTSVYALQCVGSSSITASAAHVLQLGDGSSTTPGGNADGFSLYLGASATGDLKAGKVVVNGGNATNRWVTTYGVNANQFITGDLVINSGGEFRIVSPYTILVGGNLINNGILTTTGTLELNGTALQTISGNGIFRDNTVAASVTANFSGLIISNPNSAGVSITTNNWSTEPSTVSTKFGTAARVSMPPGDTFTLGTSPANPGTLYSGNGGFTGGTVRCWLTPYAPYATISTAYFPFTSPSPSNPAFMSRWASVSAPNLTYGTGGLVSLTYVPAAGNYYTTPFNDNGTRVTLISNDKWLVSQSSVNIGTGTWSIGLAGTGLNTYPSKAGVRITGATGAIFPYATTSTSGTAAVPGAIKSNIAASDISATPTELHFGSQHVFNTTASGAWEDNSIWEGGFSPGAGCDAVVINSGDTVTVNNATASAAPLTVQSGGGLTINGDSLSIGCGTVDNNLISYGALTVSGGKLIIEGCFKATGSFAHTAGLISVTGFGSSSTLFPKLNEAVTLDGSLNLTGGTILIRNPPDISGSTAAVFVCSADYTAGGTHTVQFGDGVSTYSPTYGTAMNVITTYGNPGFRFNNVVVNNNASSNVNRTLNFYSDMVIAGDLTIMPGGIATIPATKTLSLAGNLTNNGTLTTIGTLAFQKISLGNVTSGTPIAQNVSGAGIFRNAVTSPTASFANLTFNNSSTAGITFSGNTWNALPGTVNGTLLFSNTLNRISIGTGIFTLGTSAASRGTFVLNSGGFTSGTFRQWLTTSTTSIVFPFVNAASPTRNASRNVTAITAGTITTGGTLSVKHTAVAGTTPVTPFTDNGASIAQVSKSNWTIGQSGILPTTAALSILINAEGAALPPNPYLARITGATSSFLTVGAGDTGSGTPLSPLAVKASTTAGSFSSAATVYFGMPKTFTSLKSGAYDSAGTWTGGVVPGLCDEVIIDDGHTVTVSGVNAASGYLFINAGGALVQSGSTFTVGCGSAKSSMLTNFGTLTLSGGTLAVNGGYTQHSSTSVLNQSGGNFRIDANNGGVAATSLRGAVPILNASAGQLNLSGGTLTIVDPPAPNTSDASLAITVIGSATGTHTLQLGDGVSTDASSSTNGFYLANSTYKFRDLVVNNSVNASNKRYASLAADFTVAGNVSILTGGELRCNASLLYFNAEGNLTNNGTLVIGSGGYLGLTGTQAQTISGSGAYLATAGGTGAAFSGLYFNNSSSGGVTFSGSGWHAWPVTVTTSLRFGSQLSRINIGADTFVLGSSSSTGQIINGNGGFTGGTFRRWIPTPSFSIGSNTGLFPFINPAGASNNSRNLYIATPGLTFGGYATVTYTDSLGTSAVTPFTDNGSNIVQVSRASWQLSHTLGSTTFSNGNLGINSIRISGQGLSSLPLTQGLRIVSDTASILTVGPNDFGSGTDILPQANKTALLWSDIQRAIAPKVLRFGIDKSFQSTQSGPWSAGSTWVGGISPGTSCENVLIKAGHTVTVNATAASAKNLALMPGGGLSVQASTLTVGCDTVRNYQLYNAGTLSVSGGTLAVNGAIINVTGNSFTQSGGSIIIDPNDRGNAGTSTTYSAIAFPAGGSTYSLTGGSITIVDPPVPLSGYSLSCATAAFPASGSHTVIFGNAVSADTSANNSGFYVEGGAASMAFQNIIVNGPLNSSKRSVRFSNAAGILGDLTINSGGWLKIPTSNGLSVAGNIIVNGGGTLDAVNSGTLALQRYIAGTASPATVAQSIGGSGNFIDATPPAANFYALTVNNSSAGGVTIAPLNTVGFNVAGASVTSMLSFLQGRVSMSSGTFIKGTQNAGPGSMTQIAGSGIMPGTQYAIWHTASSSGSSISGGADPGTSGGQYPFISPTGLDRSFHIERNFPTVGGLIGVTYTDAGSAVDTVSIADGSYTVTRRIKDSWAASVLYGTPNATSFEAAAVAPTAYVSVTPSENRLVQGNAVAGTHQAGTATPGAQRSGLSLISLTAGPFQIGTNAANLVNNVSVQSGRWFSASTWRAGIVPGGGDTAYIMPGHTVTVDSTGAQCAGAYVYGMGKLKLITGGYLTVGTVNNNAFLKFEQGDLEMSGGTLKVAGRLSTNPLSNISQSGGDIIVDGNAGGVAANSVAQYTPIVSLNAVGHRFNLTGGTFTITDPHTSSNSDALYTNVAGTPVRCGTGHTFRLGSGVTTEAGNTSTGFSLKGAGLGFAFGNLEINTGPGLTGDKVVSGSPGGTYANYVTGNLNIISGELRSTSSLIGGVNYPVYAAGNINVAAGAILTTPSGIQACALTSYLTPTNNPIAQTIGGAGTYRDFNTSPTGNFWSLTNYNTSNGGLSFSFDPTFSSSLILQDSSRVFLNGPSSMLTLGVSTTSPGTVTAGSSAAAGSIVGKLKRWVRNGNTGSYAFPISSDGLTNKPPTFTFTTGPVSGGTLTAQYFSSNPGFPNGSPLAEGAITINATRNGYWQIDTGNGLSGGTYTGTFAAYGANVPDYTQSVLLRRPLTGGNWILDGLHVATTGTNISPVLQRAGLSGFGQFAISENAPSVALTAALQGAMTASGTMRNDLQTYFGTGGVLPAADPYGVGESYTQINDPSGPAGAVVDWVKVEVRDANTPSIIYQTKALLLATNGAIVDTAGQAPKFSGLSTATRLTVSHRNHLPVMSDSAFSLAPGAVVSYDFTSSLSKATNPFADPAQMVFSGGKWCMWAGDVNTPADLFIDNADFLLTRLAFQQSPFDVYHICDLNLDGFVDNTDFLIQRIAFQMSTYSTLSNY